VPDARNKRLIDELKDVVAWVGVVLGLVYFSGALILGLRLQFGRLDALAVVGSLPRESAIAIGVTEVILPALALGIVWVAWSFHRGHEDAPSWHANEPQWASRHRSEIAVGAALVTIPGVVRSLFGYGLSWAHWTVVIAVLVGVLTMMLYVYLRARIAEKWGRGRWNEPRPVLLRGALVAGVAVPTLVAFWAAVPLASGRLCLDDGKAVRPWTGVYVGQTPDHVYVGLEGELYSFREDVVREVIVGKNAGHIGCSDPGRATERARQTVTR